MSEIQIEIQEQTLDCPHCGKPHSDIDEWALKPHRTHLCLHCGLLFEGSFKGVSRPTFDKVEKPENIEMKSETLDSIYEGFHWVSAISGLVLLASITGYYSLNEIGINKYNGLVRALIPVALVEFGISVGVINLIDYKSLGVRVDK